MSFLPNPAFLGQQLIELAKQDKPNIKGLSVIAKTFLQVLAGKQNDAISYAYEIYNDTYRSEILNAWIMAGATNTQLHDIFDINLDVCAAYRELFFDPTQFRDELDRLVWVTRYKGTPYGKNLLQQAIMGGIDTLMWLFGKTTEVNPQKVLKDIMTDAYFRGSSGRMHSSTSKEASAAYSYMQTAFKAATNLAKNVEHGEDIASLVIKLQHIDNTSQVTEEEKAEILH